MRSVLVVGKSGKLSGTRLPRNKNDWKTDFKSHYAEKDMGFESKCWIWGNISSKNQYGQTRLNSIPIAAHRLSWILNFGKIPNGMWVLHKCDIRHCVNPSHLFLGTHRDNMNDMVRKGRSLKTCGENSVSSILKESEVLKIRDILINEKTSIVKIASKFKTSSGAIWAIARGENWKHLGPINFQSRSRMKVSLQQVGVIKKMLKSRVMQSVIASKFGITQSQVSRINSGERD